MQAIQTFVRTTCAIAMILCVIATTTQAQTSSFASARLTGNVLSDSTERPIANASISIPELNLNTRSDSTGAFSLGGIPAGRYVVQVRAVGFAEFTSAMTFVAGQQYDADLLLRPAAQSLAKVDVKATKNTSGDNPRIAEFDERRKMGFGAFITQDAFEKADGRKLADVLVQRIPGIRALSAGGALYLVATRGRIAMGSQMPCPVQVIIDDIVQNSSTNQKAPRASTATSEVPADAFEISMLNPDRIAAVEFYTVANRPAQFNRGGAPCGTLVIWTRWSASK